MKKTVYVCDHCGKEFNSMIGYTEWEVNDFNFIKEVDLCVDCFHELCNIVREFIGEDTSR